MPAVNPGAARNVYAYMAEENGKDRPDFVSIDIDELAQPRLTVRGSGEIVIVPLPYEQLAQMLYRLRDERRIHVMSVVQAEKERNEIKAKK